MKFSFSIIICLALTGIASCGNVSDISSQNSNSSGSLIEERVVATSQKDLQSAVITNNINECKKASTDMLQDECRKDFLLFQAKEQEDVLLCDGLEVGERDSCINEVTLSKAVEEENIEVCKDLSLDEAVVKCEDGANTVFAEKKQDTSFCEKIQDDTLKNSCVSILKKDVDCSKFSNTTDKDRCVLTQSQYSAVMELVKDKKKVDCATILDMDLRQLCGQEMGLINAVEKKDKILCGNLSTSFSYGEVRNKDYREECLRDIN